MIKKITRTNQFKKDFKLAKRQGQKISDLLVVLDYLVNSKALPEKYKDHALINYQEYRECHIKPDWLLIYKIIEDELILYRLGSHSELFNK